MEVPMKPLTVLVLALCTFASNHSLAQEASASDSAKTTYAPAPAAWGDNAASHAWEMSAIAGRLEGRLDSNLAKAGDRVVLRTTEKAQTSDGSLIPAGSRLVGRVIEAQAHDKAHAASQMAIAFDRAEMKGGGSIAIYTMIRGVTLPSTLAANGEMYPDEPRGAGMGIGRMGGGGLAGAGDALGVAGGVADPTSAAAGSAGAGASVDSTASSAVQRAGYGDANVDTGAHALAAARATPHPTGIPGVMLAGSSTASGVLS